MTEFAAGSPHVETLSVARECDVLSAPALREQLQALLATGRPVVVDLSEAIFVDSACLGVFVGSFKQASRLGQPLFFLVPRDRSTTVRRVLETTGLARVLPLASSWQEIEQSLEQRPAAEPTTAAEQSQ